ncbi:MAG: GerMN domain-containing protein [Firmicutes bacterium]|nr:GerMN domain-containing protein [Bacillota bacterium]
MNNRRFISILLLLLVIFASIRIGTEKLIDIFSPSRNEYFIVYFASVDATRLVPEYRSGKGTIEERLLALQNGPQTAGLVNVLSKGARPLAYEVRGDTLFVSFSKELVLNHPGGSAGELITIYGIVNTLTEIPEIKRVQILVEGRFIETLAGHVSLLQPLERDPTLLGSSLI